jgi:hypothetical protein
MPERRTLPLWKLAAVGWLRRAVRRLGAKQRFASEDSLF